jgi:nickel-dependent lactate racemase
MTLGYGKGDVRLDLRSKRNLRVILPKRYPSPIDIQAALHASLANPVNAPALVETARDRGRIVVSIPDRTRPRVGRMLLPAVVDQLVQSGIGLDKIMVFVATGTHAKHDDQELRDLLGEDLFGQIEVRQNTSDDRSDFKKVAVTRRGTPIIVNRCLLDADLNIVISTVAFHYFAGMAGGRKMIVPGACHFETAHRNHKLTLGKGGNIHSMCRNGILDGNPVHEDMVEGASSLKNVFLVNAVMDGRGRIADLTSGSLVDSHLAAVGRAKRRLEVSVRRRCDLAIVSAAGYPFDINLIQTHKSIDHAAACIRDGGVMIAVGECAGGIGSESFLPWFDLGDAKAIGRGLLKRYELNGHTALSLVKKLERMRIILVSSLGKQVVERTGMIHAEGVEEALEVAETMVGGDALTYVLPQAWGILPVVKV